MTSDGSGKNEDPSNPGSFNRYAYANGDPVNESDPTGEGLSMGTLLQEAQITGDYSYILSINPMFFQISNLAYQGGGGATGPGPSAPGFAGLSSGQTATVNNAMKQASDWAKNSKCNDALQAYVGRGKDVSITHLLSLVDLSGSGENVWDGTKSNVKERFRGVPSSIIEPVSQFFKNNGTNTGAVVSPDATRGESMFLGPAFFNPAIAGVQTGYFVQGQALMLMHEALHLAGVGDEAFAPGDPLAGSRKITTILEQNCAPILNGKMGGLNF